MLKVQSLLSRGIGAQFTRSSFSLQEKPKIWTFVRTIQLPISVSSGLNTYFKYLAWPKKSVGGYTSKPNNYHLVTSSVSSLHSMKYAAGHDFYNLGHVT